MRDLNYMAPLAVTMGEPAGIAPDITIMGHKAMVGSNLPRLVYIGDLDHLLERAEAIKQDVSVAIIDRFSDAENACPASLAVVPLSLPVRPKPGHIETANSVAVIRSVDMAVELALEGEAGAVITNPIQKETLYQAGFRYQGHTDYIAYLAQRAGHTATPVMMLSAEGLRTIPVTVHVPVKDVPELITPDLIVSQAKVVAKDLRERFGLARPRLAISGLNPHAGENGTIGTEELEAVIPAIETLRKDGEDVIGPLPADTAFHPEARETYDAILCMFHDQALIPVKTLGFHQGVNTTLGLPFVRTSPDHGTALDLAGTGKARPDSLLAAISQAAEMSRAIRCGKPDQPL